MWKAAATWRFLFEAKAHHNFLSSLWVQQQTTAQHPLGGAIQAPGVAALPAPPFPAQAAFPAVKKDWPPPHALPRVL